MQLGNILTPIICFLVIGIISLLYDDLETFTSGGESSLIDPIGFAFAIWGPIFLFLSLFLFYQSKDLFKDPENKQDISFIDQVSVFFMLSTIMACSWYLFWSFRIIWMATLSMILYLICILSAYLRLNINRVQRSKKEFIYLVVPWSMYAGWVTAATIVSITTFFESINFNRPTFLLSDTGWAIIVLIITLLIYSAVLITRTDYIYAGVGVWVLLGIIFERLANSPVVYEVIVVCIIGIIALTWIGIYKFLQREK